MTELLPSWNDTPTKQKILDFVAAVTDPQNPDYVPPEKRIATFDNDGTLWCEKPAYIQLFFTINKMKEMVEKDPRLMEDPAYEAAAGDDMAYFAKLDPHAGGDIKELMRLIFDTHAGMSEEAFQEEARAFL